MSAIDVLQRDELTARGETPGPPDGAAPHRLRLALRYLGMPALVAAAYAILYLYVRGSELDSIERRLLNAQSLRRAATEHLDISLWATALVLFVAIPVGVTLTRPWARRLTPAVIGVANIGQGVPAIGTLVLIFIALFRNGRTAAILGLAAYAFLPVLRATMVGLDQVDRRVIKAARGMGMSKAEVLRRIELPLSVPILLTGVRIALVLVVSTAVLAAFIGGGTLGGIIVGGFAQTRPLVVVTGAVLAAGFALLADWLGGIAEDVLSPKGL
ncbi:MAG TPA: ABC transporter permease [Egibacteraceae bacterium]|nr:ABC transporter permease [Egibacteraceae bacterium]